ncbi:MAG: NAD(P)/FAD-dependent oxidoreductase [Chloroflexi bacterium]|nr:NAD(P)/FAD-dependent oxidoreductase [Chloroflexota bacterium]OJV94679.1 MAG: 4-hydroxyacetophenone monooxygenase [Chloroflexi bacterium 54-19]
MDKKNYEVAIIGTGFAGLGMAIRLKQSGQHDFVILERASELGGTWRDNSYPGCACDVQSHLYSFSFALNPEWSHVYSPQAEIWQYLQKTAEKFGIMPHIRWNSPLLEASWDEAAKAWQITTPQGDITARVLILGNGPLSEPSLPNIPGLNSFKGKFFHSACWDHDYDLTGKRVGVIGTGASAIQIVPEIQPQVGQLVLFQRTPPWIVPRQDRAIPESHRKLFKRFPLAQRFVRTVIYWQRELLAYGLTRYNPDRSKMFAQLAARHLQRQVADPVLRAKLTPNYAFGCKRILLSDNFYPALTRSNVEVVTERIATIIPDGVTTADGKEFRLDTLVCATGFHATDSPLFGKIKGRGGQILAETWREGMQAYLGSTVAGFPNMFFLIGPNTGLGHSSMILMIESQLNYIVGALRTMKKEGLKAIEVRPDVVASYNEWLQDRLKKTVWNSGCKSWYLDKQGHNTTLWPGFTFSFRRLTRRFKAARYNATL